MDTNSAMSIGSQSLDYSQQSLRSLPVRPQKELNRPRLKLPERLRSGEQGLAAVCAPAGYGKSTVMASWKEALADEGVACCWLGVRQKHADPKTLIQDLLLCLRLQVPDFKCERTEVNLRSATSYIIEPVMLSLTQEIEDHGQQIVLFLDDLDNLGQSPGKDAIAMLIDHKPDALSMVLGGRESRQFPLARHRIAGQLIEVRAEDLQFTLDEMRSLFFEKFEIDISDDVLETVAAKTEGWPAALGLFAMGVSARGDAIGFLEDFASAQGELADYLGEVLLESLASETQDILMRAAVPQHFSLELLQALVPDQDAALALQHIRKSSLFLQAVDQQGIEFRFHSLCAEFLRRRLRLLNPDLYCQLLRTAGDWSWSHDDQYESVEYAKAAGDWELMAERISQLAEPMVRASGEFGTYLGWLRDLPVNVLKRHPDLFIHQAWALGFSRDMAQAEVALTRLAAQLPTLPEEKAHALRRQMEFHRFLLDSLMDRGHPHLEAMQAWLKQYPDAPESEKGLVYGAIAPSARNANQLDLSLKSLINAEKVYREQGSDYSLSWVHNLRLSTLIKKGDFAEARVSGRKGLEMICESLGDQSPPAGMSNAMLAYLAYEKGDISTARQHLDNGMRFIANQGVVDPLYFAHLTQSYLSADDGNDELSLGILLEGEQLGIEMQLPRLTLQLATRRALRYLHMGDQMAADAVIDSRQLLDYPRDEFLDAREQCASLLKINMDIVRGKFVEAQERAKNMSKATAAKGCMRMKAEYDYLLAIAMHNSGDTNEAGRSFRELLAQAAEQVRSRFMLQYGALGRGLITEQLQVRQKAWVSGVKEDAADRVLKALADALGLFAKTEAGQSEEVVTEGLTRREIDILKHAARTGLNNKKLAESLFVSEGTLKWHLHNIYSKLSARNRAGAIAQAQRMGLLD